MAAAKVGGDDGIDALPDEVLQHMLSLLPAAEAVRTCVLAGRWRDLWKSTPVLRVTNDGRSVTWLNKFVSHLLLLRDRSMPLRACEIQVTQVGTLERKDEPRISLWIQQALLCRARILSVRLGRPYYFFALEDMSLNSRHLARLELCNIELNGRFLDFLSCPALEELWMKDCYILGDTIMSQSVKRLTILSCLFSDGERARISAPSLVALQLTECLGMTPLLESMPSLVTGTIKLADCKDYCVKEEGDLCGSCENCGVNDDGSVDCVILKGLSQAKSLELIAKPCVYIFERDLTWCPTFSNLKTLLLNEWCLKDNLGTLLCLLEHTPVLEKLTIQLCQASSRPPMATEGSNIRTGQPVASKILKVLELKCEKIDESVHNILRTLSAYGIHIDQIHIQQFIGSAKEPTDFPQKPGPGHSQKAQLRTMVEGISSIIKNWAVRIIRPGHNH